MAVVHLRIIYFSVVFLLFFRYTVKIKGNKKNCQTTTRTSTVGHKGHIWDHRPKFLSSPLEFLFININRQDWSDHDRFLMNESVNRNKVDCTLSESHLFVVHKEILKNSVCWESSSSFSNTNSIYCLEEFGVSF